MSNEASSKNHFHYNTHLRHLSRGLRAEGTKAEACLWKWGLRAGKMRGYGFRRQRPVLQYIVDFMCKELMLVIEVDGLTHEWEETVVKDIKKQGALEAVGFTVLRFTDEEVLQQINWVLDKIEEYIDEFEARKRVS
ncbi:MAG: DUF559 domain-containing protein [Bacteroidetes bacterium]|nr:DUF559 domain-containing protein [Bacteroidota bacterium]